LSFRVEAHAGAGGADAGGFLGGPGLEGEVAGGGFLVVFSCAGIGGESGDGILIGVAQLACAPGEEVVVEGQAVHVIAGVGVGLDGGFVAFFARDAAFGDGRAKVDGPERRDGDGRLIED